MVRFIFSLGLLLLTGTGTLTAGQLSSHFELDEQDLQVALQELSELDHWLDNNETWTASSMPVVAFMSDTLNPTAVKGWNGVPSFWVGFISGCVGGGLSFCFTPAMVLGMAGVYMVRLETEDKSEEKKALMGCAAGTGTGVFVGFGTLFAFYAILITGALGGL